MLTIASVSGLVSKSGPSPAQLHHVAGRFSHATQMVVELCEPSADAALPAPVMFACLEDWFTNYRLLIEFLVIGPPRNCASAQTFVPGWGLLLKRS